VLEKGFMNFVSSFQSNFVRSKVEAVYIVVLLSYCEYCWGQLRG